MKFWQKPFIVQRPDGSQAKYANFWQYVNHLRGKPFRIEFPDTPQPDLETLRSNVAANPTDVRARMSLGASLWEAGSLEEGCREYLEAIALLSNNQGTEDEVKRLSARSFARYQAAKMLEVRGRNAEAREHWQGCADDIRAVSPQKYLRENGIYQEAIAKLDGSSTL